MKICFITNSVFNLGGVQRVVSVIANKLSNDFEVHILCMKDQYQEDRKLYNLDNSIKVHIDGSFVKRGVINTYLYKVTNKINGKVRIFNNRLLYRIFTVIYYPFKMRKTVAEFINTNNFDLVIGVEGIYSILIALISSEISCKTIGWQHNSYEAYLRNKNRYYWGQDILFNKYIRKLDRYIVLTNHEKEKYKSEMKLDVLVVNNPRSFSSDEKSDVKSKMFLAAGRFNHQKGFDLLIESFREFSNKNDDWNLYIVGEGEEYTSIWEKIVEYGLENRIKIMPFTSDIQHYFLEASVLLLPSRWEGMPMIALESLEMGVPIVAYEITAMREIVDNYKEGIIVDKFDTSKFADAMMKLSESYTLRKSLSEQCIIKSNKFEINNIALQWINIIKELMEID